ncbi:FUSC family protein [Flammeovirga sp. SubArs3]|uniref:FUSC family protein n=1 Tax=Flammeovirga sp. SubArs3 TaxID=2995316 RepID=UPI00248C0717|nr:FUSC family protein [Flammeovirga sp. SubArs3]
MKKEKIYLGGLFALIVTLLLYIQNALNLPHTEWGLLSLPLLFIPSKQHYIQKSFERILGTLIGIVIILSLSLIHSPFIYFSLLALVVISLGHLSIKYRKHFYVFFMVNITLGIFGLGKFALADSMGAIKEMQSRVVEISLAAILVIVIVYIFMKLTKGYIDIEQPPRKVEELSHLQFFLRGVIAFSSFLMIYYLFDNIMLQGGATMLTILLASSSIHKNPVPEIVMNLKIIVLAFLTVFLLKSAFPINLLETPIAYTFIGIFFGVIMYQSLNYIKRSMFYRLYLVITTVVYAISSLSTSQPLSFGMVMGVFVFGIIMLFVGHHISQYVHQKIENKLQ